MYQNKGTTADKVYVKTFEETSIIKLEETVNDWLRNSKNVRILKGTLHTTPIQEEPNIVYTYILSYSIIEYIKYTPRNIE